MPDYQTIRGISTFEYEEKRSRFIASAAFADTEEAALAHLNCIKAANRTARHNVYAYVLREGGRTRYSDDGEPAKTAGTPVLEAIGHAGLSDVIVVVTRYFGGVLLGTGGLVRAYTAAASGALQQAEIVSMRLVTDCAVTVPYPKFEQAQRMIAAAGAKLQEPEYADAVTLRWRMPAGTEEALWQCRSDDQQTTLRSFLMLRSHFWQESRNSHEIFTFHTSVWRLFIVFII